MLLEKRSTAGSTGSIQQDLQQHVTLFLKWTNLWMRRPKPSLQEHHNLLVLAPLVSRFSLLPISTPTRALPQGSLPLEERNQVPLPPGWSSPTQMVSRK